MRRNLLPHLRPTKRGRGFRPNFSMKQLNNWLTNLLLDQHQWNKNKNIFFVFIILLGIALPFLLVTYLDTYHKGDVNIYHSWAYCWNQKIYLECRPRIPNYPVIGLTLTAGVIHAISSIFSVVDRNTSHLFFRYYLAFFDSLNFILLIWLAKLMGFRSPIFIGIILLIKPSTWVGGAVWGQMDGIFLFFCLLSIIGFFKSWLISDATLKRQKA